MSELITYKPVLRKKYPTDTFGTLKIRVTQNRQTTFVNLKLQIREKDFDADSGQVRSTYKDATLVNLLVENKINELRNKTGEKSFSTPLVEFAQNISFTRYSILYLERLTNHGTYIKTEGILKKLGKYLSDQGRTNLRFKEITPDFLHAYRKYLLQTLTNNTANHYLKMLKGILNKAAKEGVYEFTRDPFITISYKAEEVRKESLQVEDVRKLFSAELIGRLDEYRKAFLFQILAQGTRVSDMLTLRWGNLRGDHYTFTMFKTKKPMRVYLNQKLQEIIRERLPAEHQQKEVLEAIYIMVKEQPTLFVFPFLDNGFFSDIQDFAKVNREQYKRIKHATIVFDRNLKMIQKRCGIEVNLKSHLARHTFTSVLLAQDNVNLYEISQALGHSSIKYTEFYVSNLNQDRIIKLNNALADTF